MRTLGTVRRNDIDGLRFVAVSSVVIGHYFPNLMPSGYLGVDVFFVISGYVITQLLCTMDHARPFAFLADFYAKRIRRLAPALLTIVFFTFAICFLFLTRTEGEISKTGAYSLIGLSNVYLWNIASDYFGLDTSQNPFAHTWSLGVEEQFYVLYPLLFLAIFKFTKISRITILTYSIGVISAISLISHLALSQSKPNLSFYSMPTRLWELGVGAIVFLSSHRIHERAKGTSYRLFIFSIMLASFFVNFEIIPIGQIVLTFATGCLLIPSNGDLTSKILSHKIATWIGIRSYSIYLIHWPLLVLSNYLFGNTLIKNFICILLSVCLGSLSFSWVENPFRIGRLRSTSIKTISIGVPILLLSTAIVYFGTPKLSLSDNNLVPQLLRVKEVPNWTPAKCSGAINTKKLENPIQQCLGGSKESSSRYVFLLGDSHADQLIPMLNVTFKSPMYKVKNLNLENGRDFPFGDFTIDSSSSLKYLASNTKEGDVVVLTFHRGQLNPHRDLHIAINQEVLVTPQTQNLIRNLDQFSRTVAKRGLKIVLVLDTPLMNSVQTSQSCALQLKLFGRNGCKVSRTQDSHTRYLQEYAFKVIASKNKNVIIYDPLDFIYQGSETVDILDSDENYLMWDWHHITPMLSARLGPDFKKSIEAFIVK